MTRYQQQRKKTCGGIYLEGCYCPHCGAGALQIFDHMGGVRTTEGGRPFLRCDHCCYAFPDDAEGRWRALKFSGTGARKEHVGEFGNLHPRNARIVARLSVPGPVVVPHRNSAGEVVLPS